MAQLYSQRYSLCGEGNQNGILFDALRIIYYCSHILLAVINT